MANSFTSDNVIDNISSVSILDTDTLVDQLLSDMGMNVHSAHLRNADIRNEFTIRLSTLLRECGVSLDFVEEFSARYGVLLFGNSLSIAECYAEWLWDDHWSERYVFFPLDKLLEYHLEDPEIKFYKRIRYSVVHVSYEDIVSRKCIGNNSVLRFRKDVFGNLLMDCTRDGHYFN